MKKASVVEPVSAFKAHAVNLIIGNHYRADNEALRLENRIVWDRLCHLDQMCQVQATRLARQEQLLNTMAHANENQRQDITWFDGVLHDILQRDAHLRWQLRDRITYSDLPLYDPDVSDQETVENSVDDDFEQRTLEDDLQAQLEGDLD